jgi:D-sedoheptulose 7-phosphate isomerase
MSISYRLEDYANRLSSAIQSVNREALKNAHDIILNAVRGRKNIFVCGNGGSLSMSEHLMCDMGKGLYYDAGFKPRIFSLTSGPIITATANDIGYDDIFSLQLDMMAGVGDVLIVVSASGNSPNVVKAVEKARDMNMVIIAFTGFDGGKISRLADVVLYTNENNYGIVEDSHQAIMHVIAQQIRETFHNGVNELKL